MVCITLVLDSKGTLIKMALYKISSVEKLCCLAKALISPQRLTYTIFDVVSKFDHWEQSKITQKL